MSTPVELYIGHTIHERRQPFLHRFRYKISSILIDLDQLEKLNEVSALFSFKRFNLFSFYPKDHGLRDGSDLKSWAMTLFDQAGVRDTINRLRLLCSPRVLGYVFNPLSVYIAENKSGELLGLIYQVHNTFGDSHAYVAKCEDKTIARHNGEKCFHVSPFFDVSGQYEFTLRAPRDQFKLTIFKCKNDTPDLMATMSLNRKALSTSALLSLFASQPFSTLKTIMAIHFEALKLWIKGAQYHSRPQPPENPSFVQNTNQDPNKLGKTPRIYKVPK